MKRMKSLLVKKPMYLIFKNSFKSVFSYKIQMIGLIILVFLSTLGFTLMHSMTSQLDNSYQQLAQQSHLHQVVFDPQALPASQTSPITEDRSNLVIYNQRFINQVTSESEFKDAGLVWTYRPTREVFDTKNNKLYKNVMYSPDNNGDVDKLVLIKGELPHLIKAGPDSSSPDGSIIGVDLTPTFVLNNHLKIGDNIDLFPTSSTSAPVEKRITFTMVGIANSADYSYPVSDITTPIPDQTREAIVYVPPVAFGYAWDNDNSLWQYDKTKEAIALVSPADEENYFSGRFTTKLSPTRASTLIDDLNKELNTYYNTVFINKSGKGFFGLNDTQYRFNSRTSALLDMIATYKIASGLLFAFLCLVSLFIIYIIIRKRIDASRIQIGVLKAAGYTTQEISVSYLSYPLIASLIGGILGFGLGIVLQMFLVNGLFIKFFAINLFTGLSFDWTSLLLSIFGAIVFTGVITFASALGLIRGEPVQMMKPQISQSGEWIARKLNLRNQFKPFSKRFKGAIFASSFGKLGIVTFAILVATALMTMSIMAPKSLIDMKNYTFGTTNYQTAVEYDPVVYNSPYSFYRTYNPGINDKYTDLGYDYTSFTNEDEGWPVPAPGPFHLSGGIYPGAGQYYDAATWAEKFTPLGRFQEHSAVYGTGPEVKLSDVIATMATFPKISGMSYLNSTMLTNNWLYNNLPNIVANPTSGAIFKALAPTICNSSYPDWEKNKKDLYWSDNPGTPPGWTPNPAACVSLGAAKQAPYFVRTKILEIYQKYLDWMTKYNPAKNISWIPSEQQSRELLSSIPNYNISFGVVPYDPSTDELMTYFNPTLLNIFNQGKIPTIMPTPDSGLKDKSFKAYGLEKDEKLVKLTNYQGIDLLPQLQNASENIIGKDGSISSDAIIPLVINQTMAQSMNLSESDVLNINANKPALFKDGQLMSYGSPKEPNKGWNLPSATLKDGGNISTNAFYDGKAVYSPSDPFMPTKGAGQMSYDVLNKIVTMRPVNDRPYKFVVIGVQENYAPSQMFLTKDVADSIMQYNVLKQIVQEKYHDSSTSLYHDLTLDQFEKVMPIFNGKFSNFKGPGIKIAPDIDENMIVHSPYGDYNPVGLNGGTDVKNPTGSPTPTSDYPVSGVGGIANMTPMSQYGSVLNKITDIVNGILWAFMLLSFISSLTVIMITTNIIINDSSKIIATMKVVGYSNHKIALLTLTLYIPFVAIAFAIGLPLGWITLTAIFKVLAVKTSWVLPSYFSWWIAAIVFVIIMSIYFISTLLGWNALQKINATQALKE